MKEDPTSDVAREVPTSVVVEADGGSRGNPGPAAYGAVLTDAATGRVIAEDGTRIGTASNNVAEYRGLIGGLRLVADHAPGAAVEVRMDSKLVVEQMAGRWRIKHPDMRDLAEQARALLPVEVTWTWVPRERNAHADRLANEALDGTRDGGTVAGAPVTPPAPSAAPARGWSTTPGAATTLVVVRHGVTPMTAEKRFSGGLGGSDPGLTDEGRAQVRATADWLAPMAERVEAVIASPVRRTRESADIVAERLGHEVLEQPGFAEMEFGRWDGLSFAEVGERHRDELDAWLGSLEVPAGGGESMRDVEARVLAGLETTLAEHAGRTVVVVSHVTPIKILVARALDVPLDVVFRMELAPASVTVVSWWPPAASEQNGAVLSAGRASLRLFNARPPEADGFSAPHTTW